MHKQYMAVYVEYAGIAGMIDILHGVGLRYAHTVHGSIQYVEYAGIAGMIDILHGVGLRYAQTVHGSICRVRRYSRHDRHPTWCGTQVGTNVQAVYLELNI